MDTTLMLIKRFEGYLKQSTDSFVTMIPTGVILELVNCLKQYDQRLEILKVDNNKFKESYYSTRKTLEQITTILDQAGYVEREVTND